LTFVLIASREAEGKFPISSYASRNPGTEPIDMAKVMLLVQEQGNRPNHYCSE
jgi:hypothetical protein